jgi:glycosyltransferase involved in cell wall biosynthesis
MNWLHRLRPTGLRHRLRAEYGNWLLAFIRSNLADVIVYQSQFARRWWEQARGSTKPSSTVIYNGVGLSTYTPDGAHSRPNGCYRVLLVEGSLMGGYEMGLEVAVGLVEGLNRSLMSAHSFSLPVLPVELMVVGRAPEALKLAVQERSRVRILWEGQVPAERIPEIDRSAHLLYSADIQPACPNAVIEALACGLPVLAFDTGALHELVTAASGRVVPYGSDAWHLGSPDIPALVDAGMQILANQDSFRSSARRRAEEAFGLENMVREYLHVLLD